MIEWDRADHIRYMKPDGWDEGADGIYGDELALELSCASGEEQIMYLMRQTTQSTNLFKLNGPAENTPRDPTPLADIDTEMR